MPSEDPFLPFYCKEPDPPLLSPPYSPVPLGPEKMKCNKFKQQVNTDHGVKSRNPKTSLDFEMTSNMEHKFENFEPKNTQLHAP